MRIRVLQQLQHYTACLWLFDDCHFSCPNAESPPPPKRLVQEEDDVDPNRPDEPEVTRPPKCQARQPSTDCGVSDIQV